MELTPYVERLRHELAVAANVGGDDARALAERLAAPLEAASRLAFLDALSAASAEITRALTPVSVDVRLRGLDPEFVVTAPAPPAAEGSGEIPAELGMPVAPPMAPMAPLAADGDEGGTARINFRLPAPLKARVEEAAGLGALSVNAWLVRAVARALEPGCRAR
ncbi:MULTISPECIES: hypothetical protein [Streptomyces]|uniref:hypothetical protein n=1 Tax=Streptomyces TaxID=1883 RepID=UPI001319933F|nr:MULTISPECIES: hypothetical protein [Streptomyces]QGZ47571.1 hypothetical protein GPZ77_03435 [Streptomyces sp. QHH-9511]GGT78620.1 hypothetical protein GCM10010272_22890 [Streptomyces lateritius]